jgi:N-carbamoylputrescine amidase
MAENNARKLRVAAVQMESKNGLIKVNLEHALPFVEEASKRGAKLIVLPEFMPTGYIFTKAIWDAGEPKEGLTVKWLKEHSKRLGVYLGTSFLEADGDDFFNTFVITTPDGKEAGRVRKQTPAAFEAYFTKGDPGSHVINTEFGKIGVGICYENMLSYIPRLMSTHSVDIMLMPHSAPSPMKSIITPQKAVNAFNSNLKELAVTYAKQLGIPAVMVNKSGKWETPLPGNPFLKQVSSFPGFTAIADSDGKLKAQLGDGEAVIVEDVIIDASRKTNSQIECKGRWTGDFPWGIKIWRQVEAMGRIWYSLSSERKRRAREISSNK